jgi:hypothetical protein
MGYYHKFVNNYGKITTHLIMLLKKEAFSWTQEATKSFEKLKEIMCTTSILAMFDFSKTFIVEFDSSRHVIGSILMQEGMPLAFEGHQLKQKNLLKPIYEKETLSILHAVKNLHLYLIGRHFKVKMDHDSFN